MIQLPYGDRDQEPSRLFQSPRKSQLMGPEHFLSYVVLEMKRKRCMKIVMVVHGFPPRETAGTEWHSYLLAKELSKRHEVYVFSRGSGESYLEYEDDFDGIPVRRINSPISFTGWNTHIDDRVALSFSDFLNSLKPDLIHVQHCIGLGMSTIEVAIERCIPTLLFLHDFYFLCHRTHLIKTNGQLCLGPSNQQYCMDCILASEPSLGKDDAREHGLRR